MLHLIVSYWSFVMIAVANVIKLSEKQEKGRKKSRFLFSGIFLPLYHSNVNQSS